MNNAAVGFHCPNCVKEANRGSRQTRTPYGGQRVADPRLTSFVLIGINLAVWLLIQATGGRASACVDKLALMPDVAFRPTARRQRRDWSRVWPTERGGRWSPRCSPTCSRGTSA